MKEKINELMEARRNNKDIYFNGHKIRKSGLFIGTVQPSGLVKVILEELPDEKVWVDIMELEV